jgi:hypothetical protein
VNEPPKKEKNREEDLGKTNILIPLFGSMKDFEGAQAKIVFYYPRNE